jgi:hypothetical protein
MKGVAVIETFATSLGETKSVTLRGAKRLKLQSRSEGFSVRPMASVPLSHPWTFYNTNKDESGEI